MMGKEGEMEEPGRKKRESCLAGLFRTYLAQTGPDWHYILAGELCRLMEGGRPLCLLDLRRPEDYRSGHIPGAISRFWLEVMDPGFLESLPRDRELILICYVGHTASQIQVMLRLLGFSCRVLKYGMGCPPVTGQGVEGWLSLGLPVRQGPEP